MGNPYDGMAGGVSMGKAFGEIAFYSSIAACSAYPELLMPLPATKSGFMLKNLEKIAMKQTGTMRTIGLHKSASLVTDATATQMALGFPMRLMLIRTDTAKMMEACSDVHEAANIANELSKELRRHGSTITEETWKQDDQKVFSEQLEMYRISIDATMQLGYVTAAMTAAVAMLRFLQLTIAMALMVALAALAIAFWIAMAIPFGQGAAMSIRNAGRPLITIGRKMIPLMEQIMVYTGWAHSGVVALMTLNAGAVDSYKIGDIEGQGGLEGLAEAAKNSVGDLLEKYKRKITDKIPGV